jgi:hypothetical protein
MFVLRMDFAMKRSSASSRTPVIRAYHHVTSDLYVHPSLGSLLPILRREIFYFHSQSDISHRDEPKEAPDPCIAFGLISTTCGIVRCVSAVGLPRILIPMDYLMIYVNSFQAGFATCSVASYSAVYYLQEPVMAATLCIITGLQAVYPCHNRSSELRFLTVGLLT